MIQDAFLDAYHVTRLHKNTVGPFFLDSVGECVVQGQHIRSAVARKALLEALELPPEQLNPRHHMTFSYTLFPNNVMIFHPDYTSIIKLFPQNADQTLFIHSMLIPNQPQSEEERAHFERSFELIDSGVFEAEDIYVSEAIQQGLRSGANDHLTFGALEEPAILFHKIVGAALQ